MIDKTNTITSVYLSNSNMSKSKTAITPTKVIIAALLTALVYVLT